MTRARSLLIAIATVTLSVPAQTSGPGGQPTFRAQTAGVRVDVLVTRSGRPVGGLTTDDFILLDNGVPQDIKSADLEEVPLHVVLALDTSESLSGSRLPSLIRASQSLLGELKDTDAATLLTFHRRLDLLAHESHARAALHVALERLQSGGATSLRDATYAGLTLPTSATERALLLLFTDGRDAGSWLSEAAVLDAARVSNVVAYGVVVRDENSSLQFLEQVVDQTGGRLLRVNRNDLRSSFQEVLAEFRARYLLTYSPGDVSLGWHSIDVRLRRGNGEVRARRGYISR